MIRIIKQVAQQSGTWTPSNNLVDFKNSCEKDAVIDMKKSYVIANVQPANWVDDPTSGVNDQVHLFKFGSPQGAEYAPSCMVMNSSLSSYRDGQLEYNRDRNFYQNNMMGFENDDDMLNSMTRLGYSNDVNEITEQVAYPFANLQKTGTTSSKIQASDVVIPMSDILQLGNQKLPYTWGELTTHLELDNKNTLFSEDNPLPEASSPFNWGLLPSGAINDIPNVGADPATKEIVLTTLFADADALRAATKLGNSSNVYIRADVNGVAKYITGTIDTAGNNGVVVAANVVTLTMTADIWTVGQAITNAALLSFPFDFLNNAMDDRAAAGANLNRLILTFDFGSAANFTEQTGIAVGSYAVVRFTFTAGRDGELMQIVQVNAIDYGTITANKITLTTAANVWQNADAATNGFLQIFTPQIGQSESADADDRAPSGANLDKIVLTRNFLSQQNFSVLTGIVVGSEINFRAEVTDLGVTKSINTDYTVTAIAFAAGKITLTTNIAVWTATASSRLGIVVMLPPNSNLANRVATAGHNNEIVFAHDFGSAAAFSLATRICNGSAIKVVVDITDAGVTNHVDAVYTVVANPAYGGGAITLTLDRNIFTDTATSANGFAYSNSLNDANAYQLLPMNATNNGTTVEVFTRIEDSPYFVGQLVHLQGVDQNMGKIDIYRKITGIAWTGGNAPASGANTNTLILTFDGAAITLFAGCVNSNGCLATTLPVYQVNRMEIVLWKVNYGASFKKMVGDMIVFNKLQVEPLNRDRSSSFEKKFQLPSGTIKYIFLNKINDLVSRDEHLNKYRLYVDNFPTTDRDVPIGTPLYDDRIIRYFGQDLRTWADSILVPEVNLNWQTNPSPMVELRETANSGDNLDQSIIYLYSLVNSEIKI